MVFPRILLLAAVVAAAASAPAAVEKLARDPYRAAILIDAANGAVLAEDNADASGYPASMTKLMTFAVIMDQVKAGSLHLEDKITVSAEAARTGGSQVYLKQGEVFTVDDLLAALMVQSANDAAVALSTHVAGSKEAFVALMNAKARALGMKNTTFTSPHGLPPGKGQQPDVTTARDIALLCRDLIRNGDVLQYTSIKVRTLRQGTANPFEMRNHNHLLGALPGCDGLKTGYFAAAGYSVAVTAERQGKRVITVILGSEQRVTRDVKAKELCERGFALALAAPAPLPGATPGREDLPVVRTAPTRPAAAAAPAQAASTSGDMGVSFRVIPPSKP